MLPHGGAEPIESFRTLVWAKWRSCSTPTTLARDEVHVWRAPLDLDPATQESLQGTLAPDERRRASKFLFEVHRRRFIAARGILRDILAGYLRRGSARLAFGYNAFGKPGLRLGPDDLRLRFNVSHSERLALVAVAQDREVGIDVECMRRDWLWEEVAEKYFALGEITGLRSLPPAKRREAFFRCWTRKEACVKASGAGLSVPLSQFDTSVGPAGAITVPCLNQVPEATRVWKVSNFDPGSGYAAAVAANGSGWRLRFWVWQSRSRRQKQEVRRKKASSLRLLTSEF
jgi:4'-phosphopantetheinyl transferase